MHVLYQGSAVARPIGIEVIVNWANETTTTNPMASTVNDLQLIHRMSKGGNFILDIVVQNRVSSKHMTLPVSRIDASMTINVTIYSTKNFYRF